MARKPLKTALIGGLSGLMGSATLGAVALANSLSTSSVGVAGIDALRLHAPPYQLTGQKIAIGQVEIGRPGQFGIDKAVAKNRALSIMRVFFRDTPARVNSNVDRHAQNVASVMISSAKAMRGVAPNARLYSSAAGTPKRYGQPEECLSTQHIAQQNGGDVRAINFSFGESLRHDPRSNPRLDGNALLTLCLDWSARVHDSLYVVAGNQGKGGISIPTDNFNGVNVAFSSRVQGVFAKVAFANLGDSSNPDSSMEGLENNIGPRRSVGLLAPGDDITMVNLGGETNISSGTSFAAPHVTATVALLQEFSDRQLRTSCQAPGGCMRPWTLDARRHEVMKAILLNSADKLQDQGNGLNLGMSRTVLDKNNRNWTESDAYRSRKIPLNIQMGTGQLNAYRAYRQFSAGQWSATAGVPAIGWDYDRVELPTAAGTTSSHAPTTHTPTGSHVRDYVLDKPLQKGSFVSVTLVWDRLVELLDRNRNGAYDLDEQFRDRGLNNLNLYLMRAEDTDTRRSLWSSESDVDSVEHIFYPVPATGRYKIRVEFRQRVNQPAQPYALAWWTLPAR